MDVHAATCLQQLLAVQITVLVEQRLPTTARRWGVLQQDSLELRRFETT